VPIDYFKSGDCYALFVDGTLTGGYCLVHRPLFNLRSVIQIPDYYRLVNHKMLQEAAEFTGYFINSKRYAFFFTLHLVMTIIFHEAKTFVYSYPVSNRALGKYYGRGDPCRIYTGAPRHLEGHKEVMEPEHVEVLTKFGIFKVFMHRTIKFLKRGRHGTGKRNK
jgi:hypothetical protein